MSSSSFCSTSHLGCAWLTSFGFRHYFHVTKRRQKLSLPAEGEGLLPDTGLPIIIAIIPCYREPIEILFDTVESLIHSDYPAHLLHVFVSFDGLENKDSFLETAKFFKASIGEESTDANALVAGIKVAIHIFEHGGKTRCQANTMKKIQNRQGYLRDVNNTFVLLLDSDTRIERHSLRSFAQIIVRF
jgi:cellulose synthase/poly-beta-1,6-N-acetylglucosamine synthase-like glycosyltransferase